MGLSDWGGKAETKNMIGNWIIYIVSLNIAFNVGLIIYKLSKLFIFQCKSRLMQREK